MTTNARFYLVAALALALFLLRCEGDSSSDPATPFPDTVTGVDTPPGTGEIGPDVPVTPLPDVPTPPGPDAAADTPAPPPEDVGAASDEGTPPTPEVVGPADTGGPPCDGVWVEGAAGQLFDTDDAVPEARLTTLCTSGTCIGGRVADNGSFSFDTPTCFAVEGTWLRPILTYHGGGTYADVYYDFISEGATHVAMTHFDQPLRTVPLDAMAAVTWDDASAQTLTDELGFALSWGAGSATLPFGVEKIAARRLTSAQLPPVAGVDTLTALYAVIPDNAEFDPPATVEFPNLDALAAGTAVEVLAIGNEASEGMHPGALGVVATAHVADDAASIVLDDGQGIAVLGWLGFRPAAR